MHWNGGQFWGGSHKSNIAKVLTAPGKDVVDLSVHGWRPKPANIDQLAGSIAAPRLTEIDMVILDLCSNCAYMGTSELGLPVAAKKWPVHGKYHIKSDLQTVPMQVFTKTLNDCSPILESASAAAVVLMAPTPRYVINGCC